MNTRAVVCVLFLPLFLVTPVSAEVNFSKSLLKKKAAWYQSDEARVIADSVLQYQSPQGGWPKNTNLARTPKNAKDVPQPDDHFANSLDNEATTLPLQFLARMAHATGETRYRESFERGLDYLFTAQYPNGGWPQFWPLRKGYYSHITYNDDAMIRVMTLLRDVEEGEEPYEFVPPEYRQKAAAAVDRGIDCILKTQIRQNGQRTAWNGMSHLFYQGDTGKDVPFKDFELVAVVKSEPKSNSGFFFHTDRELRKGKYLNKGYEVQLNSAPKEKHKTGSLYAVVQVDESPVDETEWFQIRIRVVGQRIQVFVNDQQLVDYTEPANPEREPSRAKRLLDPSGGAIAIQAHDPNSIFYFKQIKIRRLD